MKYIYLILFTQFVYSQHDVICNPLESVNGWQGANGGSYYSTNTPSSINYVKSPAPEGEDFFICKPTQSITGTFNGQFEGGQKYIIRFYEANLQKRDYSLIPNSARWQLSVENTAKSNKTTVNGFYKNVIESGVPEWNMVEFVFTAPGTTTDNYEVKFYAEPLRSDNTYSYLAIDGIQIFKDGECEFLPVEGDIEVSSFKLTPGKKYVLSSWVKEITATVAADETKSYTNTAIKLSFGGSSDQPIINNPSGAIIDGWQKIESIFAVPATAESITIELQHNATDDYSYFDDIRIHPVNGSMKSFVYDPETQRLHAELDEHNYATIYEYDQEGTLVRVKKETERGVFTIKETRSGNSINK